MQPSPTAVQSEKDMIKEEFTLDLDSNNSYHMKISYKENNINFFFKSLKTFPIKFYELNTNMNDIQKMDENFNLFKSPQKFIFSIKKCITGKKYKISSNEEQLKFSIENDFFDNNIATIQIPIKEQDINTKVNSLNQVILDLKEELKKTKEQLNALIKEKEEKNSLKNDKIKSAKESFEGTEILNDEDKILISEWIDEKKVFKFNLVFSSKKDGDSASTFHCYCDGVSPTVVVVKDTNGNKLGGYTTSSWAQSPAGGSYAREKNAFTFSLSLKKKVSQVDKFTQYSIYRDNGYGPIFGASYLYIANGCTGNTSSYTGCRNEYDPNSNLFGNKETKYFQVACYEVYHVINI
jgi:hypothetical protein